MSNVFSQRLNTIHNSIVQLTLLIVKIIVTFSIGYFLFQTPASRSRKKEKSTTSKKNKQEAVDYDESANDSLVHVSKDTTRNVESLSFKVSTLKSLYTGSNIC